jgi:uncharacterized protein (TIGR02147 family)
MAEIAEFKDYRAFLRSVLQERSAKNPRYSLRAFSRDLKISSARLSEILAGKQGLSPQRAKILAELLELKDEDKNYFVLLVASQHARSSGQRQLTTARLNALHQQNAYQVMSVDAFKIISDWHHLAILELSACVDFRSDYSWIAERIAIPEAEVKMAVERMLSVGLLKKVESGFSANDEFTHVKNRAPSEAIRKFHEQVLQKALENLRPDNVDQREFKTAVLAFPRESLTEARSMIHGFMVQFDSHFNVQREKDSVYCLAVNFFSMTAGGL